MNNSNIKLSVIIPIYKVENLLNACIDSVLNQSYNNLEIILVDDGSPDKCPDICDKYARQDSRVKVIHKKNGGLSDARNLGIDSASGEYITFVDSDDFIWQSDSFEQAISYIIENRDADIISTPFLYCFDKKINQNPKFLISVDLATLSIYQAYEYMIKKACFLISAWAKFIKKAFLIENNLYFQKGITSEDTEWYFRAMRVAKKIGSIKDPFYVYRQNRAGSITNEKNYEKSINAKTYIIEKSLNFWKNDLNNKIAKLELSYCAYLWSICLAELYFVKDKSIIKKVKILSEIKKYDLYKNFNLIKIFYNVFGLKITSKFLNKYLGKRDLRNAR